jgi:HK97 gp10 family phage protein
MSDVVIGVKELEQKFNALSDAVKGQSLSNAVKAGGLVVLNAAKANIQKNGLMRTRTLSRSVHIEITESSAEQATVEIGTNLEYAAIHEFGGTITPKSSKYLAIPVGNYIGSPRNHADLKLRKTGAGNLVMVDGNGAVQYVLKQSVTIQAKPYLRPAFDEKQEEAQNAMADAFAKLIAEAIK